MPKLRWFQFSLRTLMVVVTLVAVMFSLLGVMTRQTERERKAAAAIHELGGSVSWSRPPYWTGPDSGYALFGHIYQVEMTGEHRRNVTDSWLEHIKSLDKLELLNLDSAHITDDGLKNLSELKELQTLILLRTQITDAGLQHLMQLKQLRCLNLCSTKVTDKGVGQLQKALPNCNIIRTWW